MQSCVDDGGTDACLGYVSVYRGVLAGDCLLLGISVSKNTRFFTSYNNTYRKANTAQAVLSLVT